MKEDFEKNFDELSNILMENKSKKYQIGRSLILMDDQGYTEPNSMTRMTTTESRLGNGLDGRFRKGLLTNQPNTLNGKYTDFDTKVLVSDKTLKDQAAARKALGRKNPNPMTVFQQANHTAYSSILQKSKHLDPTLREKPSSTENVLHILNMIELDRYETRLSFVGHYIGARQALAKQLNLPEDSIPPEQTFEGFLFLNEDITIPRVN